MVTVPPEVVNVESLVKPDIPVMAPVVDMSQSLVLMARVFDPPPIAIAPVVEPVPMLVVLTPELAPKLMAPVEVRPVRPEATPGAVIPHVALLRARSLVAVDVL